MKLKKILLPICAAASTAAVVAPSVTSCGIVFRNLLKKYIPTIRPWAGEDGSKEITAEKAAEIYLAKNQKNHAVFEEDLMYTMAARFAEFPDKAISKSKVTKYEASLSDNFLIAKKSEKGLLMQFGMETNLILNDVDIEGIGHVPKANINLKWELPHAAPVTIADYPKTNEEDYQKNILNVEFAKSTDELELILEATGKYTTEGGVSVVVNLLPTVCKIYPLITPMEPQIAIPTFVASNLIMPQLGFIPTNSNDTVMAKIYIPYLREALILQ